MTSLTNGPVLVGTDGSDLADAAVDWAAWEADRRGLSLRIVHGYPVMVMYPSMGFAPTPADLAYPLNQASNMLRDTAARIHGRYPDLSVNTALLAGSPAGNLVDESARASLLVVGSRGYGGFAGLLLGSVTAQLAAHSRAPVVVVRRPTAPTPPNRAVVVGVDDIPDCEPVLAFAFDEAAARGVPLVALYAWWLPPSTDLDPTRHGKLDIQHGEQVARRLLAEAIAGWADKYPDVTVELRPVQSWDPMATLLDASQQAGLMVVGRHGGNVLSRLVIGSFGDVLVRHAPCPVAIVPGS